MQLSSGEQYTIVRKLADHTDASTFYVRAFVRNARTDELLATVDLVDRGDNRFSQVYQVPTDSVGLGLYISIETSVYTDSGYTTKSAKYGDEVVTVQIKDQRVGGGGSGVDYKTIRRIIKEEVEKARVEPPVANEVDVLGPVQWLEGRIRDAIAEARVEPEKLDLVPVLAAIEGVNGAIMQGFDGLEIPEPEKIDYDRLEKGIKRAETRAMGSSKSAEEAVVKKVEKALEALKKEVLKEMEAQFKEQPRSFTISAAEQAAPITRKKFKGFSI